LNTLQKKIMRIMAGAQPSILCRSLCKEFEFLPVPWQYIRSLMNFGISNHKNFQSNSCVYSINTRNKHNFHRPNAHLSCFHISTFLADIKMFNIVPPSVTFLKKDEAKFKAVLRKY
jgi:hypothetical protein